MPLHGKTGVLGEEGAATGLESSENHRVTSLFANQHSLQCNIIEFDLPQYTFGLHMWILALAAVKIHQMTVYGIGIYFLCIKLFCAISS